MPQALSSGSVRRAGGRPKGSKNKRTLEFMQKVEARGIDPLELMLEVMHELWAEGDKLAAFACAEKIAPYTNSKLASTEVKADVDVVQRVVSAEPLTPDEWLQKYGTTNEPTIVERH